MSDDRRMEEETVKLAVPTSVRERRKARKWTQPDLAEKAGISTTAVHNLEAGKNGFTDKTLAALAEAFGCRPADLLLPYTKDEAVTSSPEMQLRSALLAFGVDKEDLGRAVSSVKVFLDDPDEQSSLDLPDDPHELASGRHVKVPSR